MRGEDQPTRVPGGGGPDEAPARFGRGDTDDLKRERADDRKREDTDDLNAPRGLGTSFEDSRAAEAADPNGVDSLEQAVQQAGTAMTPAGPVTQRKVVFAALFITAALVGLYFLVPKLTGLNQTWGQLSHGNPLWLAVGAGLELLSILGYAILFRTVFSRGVDRLNWRASIEIPLAGIAAIRLLAAAGAGGIAVTVWALRRAGMSSKVIACRIAANYAIQYSLYLLALVVCGLGLWSGAFPGGGPTALTLIPALLSAGALLLGAAMGLLPGDFERRLEHLAHRSGPIGRLAARGATVPATLGSGVRTALDLIRERRVGLLGAVAYWGFDIAVLGVSFKAFGTTVPVAVLVMGYFLGRWGACCPFRADSAALRAA
jgi:putative heme transporter